MAESGSAFSKFADKANKTEISGKAMKKWLTDAKVLGKYCNTTALDIGFNKAKTKGKLNLTEKEIPNLVKELAKEYGKGNEAKFADADAKIQELMNNAVPMTHGATKTSKTGGVGRMTDASKYTGSHKERFDSEGKGKGKDGRVDAVKNTGYVGNYKGDGTYETKP